MWSNVVPRVAWLLLLAAASCSRPAGPVGEGAPAPGGEAPARVPFDPLRRAAEGRTVGSSRELLANGPLELDGWQLVSELAAPRDTPPLGRARVGDGALVLEGERLAAVRFVALGDEPRWLEVGADVQSLGRRGPGEQGFARFGVLQVDLEALPQDLARVPGRILDQHFGEPRAEADAAAARVEFGFVRDPRARGLILICETNDPAEVGASGRFGGFQVRSASAAAAARAAADEYLDPAPEGGWPMDRPRYGRFDADLVHRHGVALPAGGRATIPVDGSRAGWRFEAWACVLGSDHDGRWSVSVEWSDGAGDPRPLAGVELVAAADGEPDTAPAGWTRFTGRVPDDAAADGALVLRVRGPEAAPLDAAAVVAGARLAPFGPAPTEGSYDRPNLLVVSLDTVRADHVGVYGAARPTTPRIDALAASSRVFTDTWTTAPYTLPAHLSMLSGQHPTVHGVQRPSQRRDSVRTPLLSELLAQRGYRTAAFTGGAMVLPRFGFGDGFERYGVLDPWINLESERTAKLLDGLHGIGPRAFATTGLDAIRGQLEAFGDEPWFLFVHTYAAHEFDPPREHLQALGALEGRPADDIEILRYLANQQPPPPEIRRRLGELYAGGVRHADALVGALVELLEARGELDSTLLVVTSDHGKEIGEHGVVGHGHVLYDELVRVPLLLRGPGIEPGRDPRPAQLVDLLPTLLPRLGVAVPVGLQGRDLLAGGPFDADRALWAEVDALFRLQALRQGRSKTIRDFDSDTVERFDLARDPGELDPLPAREGELRALDDLATALAELFRALPAERRAAAPLDDAARAHLEALGYVLDDGLLRGSGHSDPDR